MTDNNVVADAEVDFKGYGDVANEPLKAFNTIVDLIAKVESLTTERDELKKAGIEDYQRINNDLKYVRTIAGGRIDELIEYLSSAVESLRKEGK